MVDRTLFDLKAGRSVFAGLTHGHISISKGSRTPEEWRAGA